MLLGVVARARSDVPEPPPPPTPPYVDPVIAQTSAAGVNPPTFSVTAADIQVGWYCQLDFTTNGAAPDGTPDGSPIQLTSDMALGASLDWGTGPFSGGATIKWRLRYGPASSGVDWSNWSNTLTDTMA